MELTARQSSDYEYLDAGAGARLERFGPWICARPSPVALWQREQPALWQKAQAVYHRSSDGGGHWEFRERPPDPLPVRWDDLVFNIKPTGFGHMGFFPEHTAHWDWIAARIRAAGRPCSILNLFAYTGAMTLHAARCGAEVCHVDAVQDINNWARANANASGMHNAPIRWITDDAVKFTAREIRRERRYDGIILDPPSYGKGPHGEKWILEEHLTRMLDLAREAGSRPPRFVLFTCHSLGFSPELMRNLLIPWQTAFGGAIEAGTMTLANTQCRCRLPCGFFARWHGAE